MTATTRYQIEALAGGQWHWRHGSADGDRNATLFDTREEAEAALGELAAALGCDQSELRVTERADVA